MRITENIVYDARYPECYLNMYLPDEEGVYPVMVYFHGGGLEHGSPKGVGIRADYLTAHGVAVVSAGYRKYPAARYPDYLKDAAKAVKWTLDEENHPNVKFSYVTVGGSSAGGYISMMLAFDDEFYKEAGVNPRSVKAYMLDAGQPTVHFNILTYERGMDRRTVRVDETAPVYYIDHEYSEEEYKPLLLIQTCDDDMVNRWEQLHMLYTAMVDFGYPKDRIRLVEYKGYSHCAYGNDINSAYFPDMLELVQKAADMED